MALGMTVVSTITCWVVERTHTWIAGFGKPRIRFERRLYIYGALLMLAAAIICSRFVEQSC